MRGVTSTNRQAIHCKLVCLNYCIGSVLHTNDVECISASFSSVTETGINDQRINDLRIDTLMEFLSIFTNDQR